MSNVLFLDYDGVVNTRYWRVIDGVWRCPYNYPSDGAVSNTQAVQWVSHFCEKFNYDIVVTSMWAEFDNYAECLRNAGLRENIIILGAVDVLHYSRSDAIAKYLEEHPEVDMYIIVDNDKEKISQKDRLILCNHHHGFGQPENLRAEKLHKKLTSAK